MALGLLAVGMAAVSAPAQTLRRAIRAAAGRCVVVLLPVLLAAGISGSAAAQSMLTLTSSGTTQVFPITAVGQSSSQSFTLTASGVDQVDLWSVQIAPGYSATYEYQIISTTCSAYLLLQPGASCSFTVNFSPKLPGSASAPVPIGRTAPLQVIYQYADPTVGWTYQVVNIPLIGSGTTPTAVMTPGLISDLVGSDISPKTGYAGDGGVASGAVFSNPAAIAVDGLGNIYIADKGNNVVRVVYMAGGIPNVASPVAGKIYTVAGIAPTSSASTAGAGVDGVAATASPLNGPSGIALDAAGNLYIADTGNSAVRMVSAVTGNIFTVAGTLNNGGVATSAGCCFSGDQGLATSAQLYNPAGIAVDGNGNIYIADSGNNAIRVVYVGGTPLAGLIATEYASAATAATGDIYTIAGGPGNLPATGNGDGGLASAASLNLPLAVTVDSAGDLYIADSQDQSVRRVDAVTGNIGTLYQAATSPLGLSVDASDDIDFTLQGSCTVLQYNPTTQYGMVTPAMLPVAGNGSCTASGDGGAATAAGLNGAPGLVVDGAGNLYLLEADGVRFVDGSQTSFAFGSANVGNISPAQAAIVTDEDIIVPNNPALSGLQGYYSGYFTVTSPFATTPYTNPNANPFNPNLNSNDCSNNQAYFALSPGDTCGTSFVFQPIADSTGGLPFTQTDYSYSASNHVQLSGTGTGPLPTVTLTPGTLTFTSVAGAGYGAAQTLTLTNTSNVNLTISSINGNGTFTHGSYKETDNCGSLPSILPANSHCTLSVSYAASASGIQAMTLTVTDNATSGGGTQSATLNGTGTAPVAGVSPGSINFATLAPGTTSAASIVTVSNTGTAPLTFCSTAVVAPSTTPVCFGYYTSAPTAAFTFSGNEADMFSVVGTTCGATLAISSSCTVSVAISPNMPGYFTATLSVNDNSGGTGLRYSYASQNVGLVGSGYTPAGTSSFTIGNATFTATPVGQSTTQTVTLRLNNSLALKSIAMQTGFAEYTLGTVSGCTVDGTTVNSSTTVCSIPVTFTPTAPGIRNAPLVVTTTENGGTPYAFALTGTGTGPVAALTPGIISRYVGGSGGVCTGVVGEDGISAANAFVGFLNGMAIDPAGNMYLSDSMNYVIWRVDPSGSIHMFAGSPFSCGGYDQFLNGNGGAALGANVEDGGPLAVDSVGGLYIGDNAANSAPSIRYINPVTKIITSVLGNLSNTGGQGNGWGANTYFYPGSIIEEPVAVPNIPQGTGFHNVNFLFTATQGGMSGSSGPAFPNTPGLTATDGSAIWMNEGAGTTTGVGCPGQTDSFGDGCTGTNASLYGVSGIALDQAGNLYFADRYIMGPIVNGSESAVYNAVVRRMDAKTGIVTIYAGNGTYGHSGDGGAATSANIIPGDIAFDSNGNLYINEGLQVRMVNATTHIITTVAGSGVASRYQQDVCYGGGVGDGGTALSAGFGGVGGIALDAANNLYLMDYTGCSVRRVDQATQTITTISGNHSAWAFNYGDINNVYGFDWKGSAYAASLAQPLLARVDGLGNIYVMEMSDGVRKIDVSKSVLDYSSYGTVPTGTSNGPQTVTVLNAGNTGPLTFNSPFTSPIAYGISTVDFTRDVSSADCILLNSNGLAPGTECPVNIDFTPTVAGNPLFDTDQVTDNGALPTQTINLYGYSSGTPAPVTLLPPLLSFASMVNVTTAVQNFTLSNNTSSSLPIASILLTGSGASVFAQTNNCGTTLAANSTCQIAVTFTPTASGQSIATVTVSDVVGGTPATQTAGLTGLTGTPNAILTNDQLNFGSQNVGIASAVKNLTLTSTGVVPLTISSITLTGTDTSQFAIGATTCGTTLAPLAHCTIPVTFTPTSDSPIVNSVTTPFSAYVSVVDNAPNTPQRSTLTGTGIGVAPTVLAIAEAIHVTDAQSDTPATILNIAETIHVTDGLVTNLPNVTLSASSLNFGSVTVNTTSPSQTVTLTNNQAVALHFSSITVAAPYAIVSTGTTCAVGTPVTAAGSCTLALTFTPTLLGATPGTLTIGDDAPNSPQTVSLSGSGIATTTQAITFTDSLPVTAVYSSGLTYTISATGGGSGNAVTFGVTGPATLTGSTLTITGVGTVVVTANQAGNSNYSAATAVTQSVVVNQAAQTITFTQPTTPVMYSSGLTIPLSATGGASGNAVVFTIDASSTGTGSITGSTLTVTGVGSFVIDANQAGNPNYSAAPQMQKTVALTQAAQAIAFTQPATPVTYGVSPITLVATGGTSGNAVVFTIDASSTGTGTISGSTLTVTGVGTLVIDANQAGSANYSAATQVQRSVVVNKVPQAITFTQPTSPVTYGVSPITLVATGGASGNTVVFTIDASSTGTGTISGSTLTVTGVGTLVIDANQAGSANYSAATQMTQSIVVSQATPAITWPTPAAISYGTVLGATQLDASSTVAGTFAYSPAAGAVPGAGSQTLSVTFTPTNTTNYATATAHVTLAVNKASLLVTANSPAIAYGAAAPSYTATITGFQGTDTAASSVTGSASLMTVPAAPSAVGGYAITAAQGTLAASNYTFSFANGTLTIGKATSSLTGPALSAQPVQVAFSQTGSVPVTVAGQYSGTGIATPTGTISYTIGTGTAQLATISSGTATVSIPSTQASGLYTVAVTYAGDTDYNAATALSFQVQVGPQAQSITFNPLAPVTYGAAPITLSATATSGLPVTFTVKSGAATLSGNMLTVTGAGSVVIAADQAGNTLWQAAAEVTQTLTAGKAAPASIGLASSSNPVLVQNAVTLTATVPSAAGSPTGTVTFLDGATPLGTGTLAGGVATLTTSGLAVGSHTITSVYSGDGNFISATSAALTEVVDDFNLAISVTSGSSSITSVTALPGGTAVFTLTVSPINAATFPSAVTLSVSGLPEGAIATFSPITLPAGSGTTTVTLTIQLPQTAAALQPTHGLGRGLAPFALALLLLPFAGRLRRAGRRLGRTVSLLLLLGAGLAAAAGLSGCGSSSGFFGQPQTTYTVTVTGSSGALSHSTTVILTIE
jgi:sugar lactone lactonase YvrE